MKSEPELWTVPVVFAIGFYGLALAIWGMTGTSIITDILWWLAFLSGIGAFVTFLTEVITK